ncbi:MAG: hypothetical protein LAN83_20320 [Acidobacteriia bacterium]|nr:hypothetical protein [Terriglobia bacterium]
MSTQRETAYGWLVAAVAVGLVISSLALAWRSHTPSLKSVMAQRGREVPADLQVIVSEHSKLFHIKGCTLVHQSDHPHVVTAGEAMKEGYVPCVRCLGAYVGHVAMSFIKKSWQAV